MRYVALLRGINVGGKSLIRMADLRECVEDLGYDDVSTFIASGNVLFGTAVRDVAKLESAIERALEQRFSRPIAVVVRTRAELGRVVKAIPPSWIGNDSLRVNVSSFAGRSTVASSHARSSRGWASTSSWRCAPRSSGRRVATPSRAAACRSSSGATPTVT